MLRCSAGKRNRLASRLHTCVVKTLEVGGDTIFGARDVHGVIGLDLEVQIKFHNDLVAALHRDHQTAGVFANPDRLERVPGQAYARGGDKLGCDFERYRLLPKDMIGEESPCDLADGDGEIRARATDPRDVLDPVSARKDDLRREPGLEALFEE